jgi:exopolyphosphatase/guanosine-5'-triphosphate,3'-diphosphate pyrophosphatase
MRVGVVDLGSNSTRLLVADVREGEVEERDRRSRVTRLADGLERSRELSGAAMERVHAAIEQYAVAIAAEGCEASVAIMTSAVRDAANGHEFAREVRQRHGLHARVLSGDEEARLTFLGASAGRPAPAPGTLAVIDVGGGSTELVTGRGAALEAHASLQVGVVRHSERHLHHDPPTPEELRALQDDARGALASALPARVRGAVGAGIAVAGTPTSCAAMALELEPYDRTAVEGFVLEGEVLEEQLARLSTLDLTRRRALRGLHPDRAPTIVAGIAILLEALRTLGLERVTVSERDVLHGASLKLGMSKLELEHKRDWPCSQE